MSEKIVLYMDQRSLVKRLTKQEAGLLLCAIFDYSAGIEEEQIMSDYFADADRMLSAVWGQVKDKLEYNKRKEAEYSQKQREKAMSRWKKDVPRDADVCHGKPQDTSGCHTYTYTETITKHSIGRNGKTYRTEADGTKRYWDDNSVVEEGDV